MVITTASDCGSLTVTSPLFVDSQEPTYTLEYKSCGDTEFTTMDITFGTGIPQYTITPTMLGQTDEICDGIYCFKLTATYTDESIAVEYAQEFVDCVAKCNIVDIMMETLSSDVRQWYEAVHDSTECFYCDCEKTCDLYQIYLDIVANSEANLSNPCTKC